VKKIIEEIGAERERQRILWPEKFDRKNTANDWAAYIARYVLEGAYDGSRDAYTRERFREYLVKAATLCVAAIEALDAGGPSPRHYDK
jgi:hypothetical protein